MIRRPPLFSPSRYDSVSRNGEIDLREEFDQLIFGKDGAQKHGHLVAIRHMRRENGVKVKCTCINQLNANADPDCSYCYGEGYLWDEKWYMCRSMYVGADGGLAARERQVWPGNIRADSKIFYFRYDVPLKYGDKIVEMKLDTEGQPLIPYIREAIYKPQTINKLRSDNGRIEFITVYVREDDAIRQDEY